MFSFLWPMAVQSQSHTNVSLTKGRVVVFLTTNRNSLDTDIMRSVTPTVKWQFQVPLMDTALLWAPAIVLST